MNQKSQHSKMSIFPKLSYSYYQILARFLVNIDKFILKFVCKVTGPRKTKTILTKKDIVREITLTYAKVYCVYKYSCQNGVLSAEGYT